MKTRPPLHAYHSGNTRRMLSNHQSASPEGVTAMHSESPSRTSPTSDAQEDYTTMVMDATPPEFHDWNMSTTTPGTQKRKRNTRISDQLLRVQIESFFDTKLLQFHAVNCHLDSIELLDKEGKYTQMLRQEFLTSGDFHWAEMRRKRRNVLSHTIVTKIMEFMRRENILGKNEKEHPGKMARLYNELQIGSNAPPRIYEPFLLFCRQKVNHCMQSKGRMFRAQKLAKVVNGTVEWDTRTLCWMEEHWDGKLPSPPPDRDSKSNCLDDGLS